MKYFICLTYFFWNIYINLHKINNSNWKKTKEKLIKKRNIEIYDENNDKNYVDSGEIENNELKKEKNRKNK